jgi:hypothetical protein
VGCPTYPQPSGRNFDMLASVEITDRLQRLVDCADPQGKGGMMSSQDENDAVTEAWIYAVLDALEAADDNTRLEVARILCPMGFEIVRVDVINLLKH